MRHMMFTDNKTGESRVRYYNDNEMTEVFSRSSLDDLNAQGFCRSRYGIWIDMEYAARKHLDQIKKAVAA